MVSGAMRTRNGSWRVEVGGVGSIVWYHVVGPGVDRWLPSTNAMLEVLAGGGVDVAELVEEQIAA
jgi:hypothetical protein